MSLAAFVPSKESPAMWRKKFNVANGSIVMTSGPENLYEFYMTYYSDLFNSRAVSISAVCIYLAWRAILCVMPKHDFGDVFNSHTAILCLFKLL